MTVYQDVLPGCSATVALSGRVEALTRSAFCRKNRLETFGADS